MFPYKNLLAVTSTHPLYSPKKPSFLTTLAMAWKLVLCSRTFPPSPERERGERERGRGGGRKGQARREEGRGEERGEEGREGEQNE